MKAALLGLLLAGAGVQAGETGVFLALDARGGFDAYHNLAAGDGFAQLRGLFVAEGFSLVPKSSFTEESLLGVNLLALLQPYGVEDAYTAEEIGAIRGLVERGGGLLVLGEGGTGSSASYLNDLGSAFGVSFAATPSDALGATVTGFVPHALTSGLSGVAVDYQRRITAVAPALDLTVSAGADDFLAVSGRAVFLGDSSVFMDPDGFSDASLAQASNALLAQNVARYLAAVPEPVAGMPVATALLAFAGWRWGGRGRGRGRGRRGSGQPIPTRD